VPDFRNELPGAFAELKLSLVGVYVPGATANATEAETAISNVSKAVMIPSRRILFVLSFVWFTLSGERHLRMMTSADGRAGKLSR
jgi:hypothetical protein